MSRSGKQPSRAELERDINRALQWHSAFLDEKIKEMVGGAAGVGLWTDPSTQMIAARKAIAEFIARDLQSWEYYRDRGIEISVEDVEKALPFGYIREKLRNGHRTNLESLIEKELQRRGEEYQFEAQVDFYHVDFFLPQRNLLIECDQEYWHGSPEAMGRDLRKTLYLREKGYRVARLLFDKEPTPEGVKRELDELLDGKKASLQTVLTPPLREALERRLREIQQRSGKMILSEVDYLKGLQRLLDEDAQTASESQPSWMQRLRERWMGRRRG